MRCSSDVVHVSGLAWFVCHVHRFCHRVGSRAAPQAVDAECVALVPAWAIWSVSQAGCDTHTVSAQFAIHFLTGHGTLPERERRKWRARPGSGGGRGGDKDGLRKNALFAPQAFTTAEKKERHTLRTRAPPLPLSQECDVRWDGPLTN